MATYKVEITLHYEAITSKTETGAVQIALDRINKSQPADSFSVMVKDVAKK